MGSCCQSNVVNRVENIQYYEKQRIIIINLSEYSINKGLKFLEEILKCEQYTIKDLNIIIQSITTLISSIGKARNKLIEFNTYGKEFHKYVEQLQQQNLELKQSIQKYSNEGSANKNISNFFINSIPQHSKINYIKNYKGFGNKQLEVLQAKIKVTHEIYYGTQINLALLFFLQTCGEIIVYGFKSSNKLLKTLRSHKNLVTKLTWMKKSNLLLSGGYDALIIIWSQELVPYQILKGHRFCIFCMITNEEENLIISGSNDKSIKFWKKLNLYWFCQQTIDLGGKVRSLSFNPQQTKLIACCLTHYNIYIIEFQGKQWSIIQSINRDYYIDACFTSENQLIFQQLQFGFLERYDYESEANQFVKAQPILISKCNVYYYFLSNQKYPFIFIKRFNTLLVFCHKFINILHLNQNGELELQQSIEFEAEYLKEQTFVNASEDGEFLVALTRRGQFKLLKLRNLFYNDEI